MSIIKQLCFVHQFTIGVVGDAVEAHAMALNGMGTLLDTHVRS